MLNKMPQKPIATIFKLGPPNLQCMSFVDRNVAYDFKCLFRVSSSECVFTFHKSHVPMKIATHFNFIGVDHFHN